MKNKLPIEPNQEKEQENKKLVWRLLFNSVILIAIYYIISEVLRFPYIMFVYLAAGIGLGLYYVIYNRGFVGKDTTPEMLPDTMSPMEKEQFLEESRNRMKKSKWVLTLLIPIILTFAIDIIYLFLFPTLKEIFL